MCLIENMKPNCPSMSSRVSSSRTRKSLTFFPVYFEGWSANYANENVADKHMAPFVGGL